MKTFEKFSLAAYVAVLSSVLSLLIACSDDSGSNSNSNNGESGTVECSDDLDEARLFLMKSQTYYVCVDGKLVPVNGISSSSEKSKSSSSVKSKSSSSAKAKSSSSVKTVASSSDKAKSSSSVKTAASSSAKAKSSSSVKTVASSDAKAKSSSSMKTVASSDAKAKSSSSMKTVASSDAKAKSSSSVKTAASSSAKAKSSSSVKTVVSSSAKAKSSSSVKAVASSSSEKISAKSSSSIYLTLWSCDENLEGSYIYLEDTKQYFVCNNSEWKETDKADLDLDKIHCTGSSNDSVSCFVDLSSSSAESSSSVKEFDVSVGDSFTDARDKQVYKQVLIGNQLWMAQNLNYKTSTSVCPQDSLGSYCDEYGRLYPYDDENYHVVLNDDLCPAGWTIPSEKQWLELLDFVAAFNGGEGVGKSLKSKNGWFAEGAVYKPNAGAARFAVASGDDPFGFTALPAGSRWGSSIYTHDETRFWTKSTKNLYGGYQKGPFYYVGYKLSFDSDDVKVDSSSYASKGFSIRCINMNYGVGIYEGYCTEERDGDMVNIHGDLAICDKGLWRYANAREVTLGICDDSKEGKSKAFLDSSLYQNPYENMEYYTCENARWRTATEKEIQVAAVEADYGACDAQKYNMKSPANYYDKKNRRFTSVLLICDKDGWREPSEIEQSLGLCYLNKVGTIDAYGYGYPQKYAVCEKSGWREATLQEEMDYRFGECAAKSQDSMVFRGDAYYLCNRKVWRKITVEENMKGLPCVMNNKLVSGNYYGYYVCKADSLVPASGNEVYLDKGCSSINEGDSVFNKQNGVAYDYYKCIDGVWKHYNTVDSTAFGKVKDERDGQTYRTIKIGEQTWLAENLNYEMEEGSYCYRDSSKYCNIYGHLYSQEAALTACPVGWHLPSTAEWKELPDSTKSILDLRDFSWDGSNKYGFSALPAGYGTEISEYSYLGEYAGWWTSTNYSSSNGYIFGVMQNGKKLYNYNKYYRFSVRCVLDVVIESRDTTTVVNPKSDTTTVMDP